MESKIISFVEPQDVQTGIFWFRPGSATSANSAFLRLGMSWIELGSNMTIPFTFDETTILIDGCKYMAQKGSIVLDDVLTKEVDTLGFTVETDDLPAPMHSQEVLLFTRETGADPVLKFGGYIVDAPQVQIAPFSYAYNVSAADYSQLLARKQVTAVYEGQTLGYIVRDIVNKYALELGTFYVDDNDVLDYVSFNYKFPVDCIQQVCDTLGLDWYVDEFRNLHIFDVVANAAPYSLTDSPLDGEFSGLEINVDKSQLGNSITVRGGYQLSNVYTDDVQVATSGQKAFTLKYTPYAPWTAILNGATKTVGIENVDTSGFDFVMNQSEKVIKCLAHAPLTAGDIINPRYTYQVPIKVARTDPASINAMKVLEGGDGIYERPLIVDDTLATPQACIDRALAELDMYSNPLITGSFMTTQKGYRSGQTLSINIPSRNLNIAVLISEVSATSLGGGLWEYQISIATKLKGLTQFLIALFHSGQPVFARTDEILENLIQAPDDAVAVADSVPTNTIRVPASSPYVYDTARYDLSSYA